MGAVHTPASAHMITMVDNVHIGIRIERRVGKDTPIKGKDRQLYGHEPQSIKYDAENKCVCPYFEGFWQGADQMCLQGRGEPLPQA